MELHVGFVGIIKLTLQIIYKNSKHFLSIAFILALPCALNLLLLDPSSKYASQAISAFSSLLHLLLSPHQPHSPSPPLPFTPPPQPSFSLPLLLPILIFSVAISLVSQPLLSFSFYRAVLHHSLDLKGSLRGVPRSVTNLVLTYLCEFAVLFGFIILAMLVMAIIAAVLSAMKVNLAIPMAIWAVGMIVGLVYLSVCFSLADAVAILEEKKGWEAMKRSMYLLGGRKWLAFWLSCVFSVLLKLLPIPVSKEVFLIWRWSAAAVSVGLQAFMLLFSMCAHVLLYLSCKSHRKESFDTLIAASAQFGPHELSAKYADLETAATTQFGPHELSAKYADLETAAILP